MKRVRLWEEDCGVGSERVDVREGEVKEAKAERVIKCEVEADEGWGRDGKGREEEEEEGEPLESDDINCSYQGDADHNMKICTYKICIYM